MSLLLKEMLETLSFRPADSIVPYLVTCFTTRALAVLSDPAHVLYPKINRFLNRFPSWITDRLPSHWEQKLVCDPPDEDTAHWQEVEWFLDWLFDGLRTLEDMNILRVCNSFERLLSLYSSPHMPRSARDKILAVVARATWIDGGSTTLVTRSAVLSWLDSVIAMRKGETELLKALVERIWETCDHDRVKEWSAGEVERRLGIATPDASNGAVLD